jgi:adenylate kinase
MTGPIAQTGKPKAAYRIGRDLGMTADMALHLQASDGELMRRLLARAGLEHRCDDIADIIAQRLDRSLP